MGGDDDDDGVTLVPTTTPFAAAAAAAAAAADIKWWLAFKLKLLFVEHIFGSNLTAAGLQIGWFTFNKPLFIELLLLLLILFKSLL